MVTVHQAPGSFHELDDGQVDQLADDARPGFDWGRPSPGSERLAEALLRDVLAGEFDPALARQLTQEILIPLPYADPWVLWSEDIRAWATKKGASPPS